MKYNCEVTQEPEHTVVTIRTRTPVQTLPATLGMVYGKIMQYLGEIKEFPAGFPFVIYYNMDMQDLDIEVGFPVAKSLPGKEDINCRRLPEEKVISCVYTGPYQDIEPAYNDIEAFIKEHNYQTTEHMYEIYLNDPASTPPEQLQTRIVFPLKA